MSSTDSLSSRKSCTLNGFLMATSAIARFGLSTALSRLTSGSGLSSEPKVFLQSQVVGRANSEGHDGMGKQCGNWSKISQPWRILHDSPPT